MPYKPKTPEIIDLDEYPESPQSVKKKKLDILKERGLEVTAVPNNLAPIMHNSINPPLLNQNPVLLHPAIQHPFLTQAQLFHMYNNMVPQTYTNGVYPPKVIQGKSIFGSTGPEKTVYGNPKDPFMPPPHVLQGTPIKPARNIQPSLTPAQDILDLTCKSPTNANATSKPAVEIVRVPNVPSTSPNAANVQNLSRNYTLVDGKAVLGSNLEITLVGPKQTSNRGRPPQKRSSNGKFVSTKSPPPKDAYVKTYPSPPQNVSAKNERKQNLVVPNYPLREDSNVNLSAKDNAFKNQNINLMELQKNQVSNMTPFMDPVYMNALYSSLAGQLDHRQLAVYREIMAGQLRGYSGVLGGLATPTGTPTTKN